jgi:hypothetical protein
LAELADPTKRASTMTELSKSHLDYVRSTFSSHGIVGLIVGSGDAHQSEYVMSYDKRRQFISNFHGSAGTALILMDKALLWTDGRYFLQANLELSDEWTLMKSGKLPLVVMISATCPVYNQLSLWMIIFL